MADCCWTKGEGIEGVEQQKGRAGGQRDSAPLLSTRVLPMGAFGLLAAGLLLLVASGRAWGTLVQHAANTSISCTPSVTVTLPAPVSSGDIVIVRFCSAGDMTNPTSPVVSDSVFGSYQLEVSQGDSLSFACVQAIYCSANSVGATSVTVNFTGGAAGTGGACGTAVSVAEYANAFCTLDQAQSANSGTMASPMLSTGTTAATTNANDLVLIAGGVDTLTTATLTGAYGNSEIDVPANNRFPLLTADETVSSTGPQSGLWTLNPAEFNGGLIAALQARAPAVKAGRSFNYFTSDGMVTSTGVAGCATTAPKICMETTTNTLNAISPPNDPTLPASFVVQNTLNVNFNTEVPNATGDGFCTKAAGPAVLTDQTTGDNLVLYVSGDLCEVTATTNYSFTGTYVVCSAAQIVSGCGQQSTGRYASSRGSGSVTASTQTASPFLYTASGLGSITAP